MNTFTLGCDPELVCRDNGEFVDAHQYFKARSSFGLDGCECIAEIRPGYSVSPLDLTSKIRTCLEYGHEKAPHLEFFAGHFQDERPLGGHIHFGTPATDKVIDGLDTVLYSLSSCIDNREQRYKREKTGYGKRKSVRSKSYGFEYRTPGSFLLSASVTLVTLTLAKLSVIAVKEDKLDLPHLKGSSHAVTFLKNLKSYLITVPDDCVEGLNELEILIHKRLDWNQNILPNWGIAA